MDNKKLEQANNYQRSMLLTLLKRIWDLKGLCLTFLLRSQKKAYSSYAVSATLYLL